MEYHRGGQNHDGFEVKADGAFRVVGIPPGSWDAHLEYLSATNDGHAINNSEFLSALARLRKGETRILNADLDRLVHGTVTGRVFRNVKLVTKASLLLSGTRPNGRSGKMPSSSQKLKLKKDGTFSCQVAPGSYRLLLYGKRIAAASPFTNPYLLSPAKESIQARTGVTVNRDFHVQVTELRIRILGSNKKPLKGIRFTLSDLPELGEDKSQPTDEDGWTHVQQVPIETLKLSTLPKYIVDPVARAKFFKANKGRPFDWNQAMVQLGKVQVKAQVKVSQMEVQLPASSGY